jgi:hypothetical protein
MLSGADMQVILLPAGPFAAISRQFSSMPDIYPAWNV